MPGFVLRVLLCVSLILGGASSAVAGVQSYLAHAQPVRTEGMPEARMGDTDAPCHEASPDERPDGSRTADILDGEPGPHGPDCCKPGHCEGACVQLAQAALWFQGFDGSITADVAKAFERESVHAAPDPQHLIRPPIG